MQAKHRRRSAYESDDVDRQAIVRVLFAAFFIGAGVTHFTNREFFTAIVPPYLPWPVALVDVSGVAEIFLGVLLLVPRTAGLAGWG